MACELRIDFPSPFFVSADLSNEFLHSVTRKFSGRGSRLIILLASRHLRRIKLIIRLSKLTALAYNLKLNRTFLVRITSTATHEHLATNKITFFAPRMLE